MRRKSISARALEFLNGIPGEHLHPIVVTFALNNQDGCGDVSEDVVRWALEGLEKRGKIKRRKQYGIRGNISWHYAGLERSDLEKTKR